MTSQDAMMSNQNAQKIKEIYIYGKGLITYFLKK